MIYLVEIDGGQINVLDASGNVIDPAKEGGNLADVKTVLTAIRDTAGVKKIVDPLPAGTNEVGKVAQGTKGVGGDAWPQTLYDSSGHPVGVVLDGALYRLQVESKVARASDGSHINPATQETLAAIKDSDGVKKIVDQLPTGTNEIGKVAQGTKAAGSGAWPQVLYDADGHAVGVVLDGSVYRLRTEGKVAKGSTDLVILDAIDTLSGCGRLKTTLYTPEGEPVAFGSVAPNPSSIKNDFVKASGSDSLLTNGSVTPVVFTYAADAIKDISLQELKFVLSANGITFGTNYFGSVAGPLTNGLLVEVIAGGNTGTVYNLLQNESFVNFASPGGFEWVVSSKDLMASTWLVGGGLKLVHGTSDVVRVTVRDDLHAAGIYFKCFVKGNLLG
jgi:hypothetical protein